jgi:hypothetical protein
MLLGWTAAAMWFARYVQNRHQNCQMAAAAASFSVTWEPVAPPAAPAAGSAGRQPSRQGVLRNGVPAGRLLAQQGRRDGTPPPHSRQQGMRRSGPGPAWAGGEARLSSKVHTTGRGRGQPQSPSGGQETGWATVLLLFHKGGAYRGCHNPCARHCQNRPRLPPGKYKRACSRSVAWRTAAHAHAHST